MHSVPTIGVLMLDTQFPRPVGDIGNPKSFSGPVIYRLVEGVSATEVVRGDPSTRLSSFIDAGRALIAEGAAVITTSCGFLSLFQDELEAALSVPVVTSSLMQIRAVEARLGDKVAGVLTIDAAALSSAHLGAVGIRDNIAVVGLPRDGELATTVFNDLPDFDQSAVEAEMIHAAKQMVENVPNLGALVFECTNMGPYKSAVEVATGVPVYTILDAINAEIEGGVA